MINFCVSPYSSVLCSNGMPLSESIAHTTSSIAPPTILGFNKKNALVIKMVWPRFKYMIFVMQHEQHNHKDTL
uniref:Uncharacterized protein n=1 Tax=Arion vulgaris TaxID=1028688 RepID=A0A0B6ZX43_9EUPU